MNTLKAKIRMVCLLALLSFVQRADAGFLNGALAKFNFPEGKTYYYVGGIGNNKFSASYVKFSVVKGRDKIVVCDYGFGTHTAYRSKGTNKFYFTSAINGVKGVEFDADWEGYKNILKQSIDLPDIVYAKVSKSRYENMVAQIKSAPLRSNSYSSGYGSSSSGSSRSSSSGSRSRSKQPQYMEVIEYAPEFTGKAANVWCAKCGKYMPRHAHIKKRID